MSAPQTTPPIQIPIPLLGMNRRDPLASMNPSFCPWMLNWEINTQYINARNGWHIHATLSDETDVRAIGTYDNNELWALGSNSGAFGRIYDITTAGTYASGDATHTMGAAATTVYTTAKYAGRLAFMTDTSAANLCRVYDGSSWTAAGWSEGGGDVGGYGIRSYRGRVYFFNGYDMYYGALEAVTGAMTKVDMSYLFEEEGSVCWCEVLTSPGMRSDELFLAFGNSAGEVLVYGGDHPGANNWEQVGNFKISPILIVESSSIAFQNDVWIMTETGIFSLRMLFNAGSDNIHSAIVTDAITPYWTELVTNIRGTAKSAIMLSYAKITYWPDKNRVYVAMRGKLSSDGTYTADTSATTIFVYNTINGAWSVHQLASNGGVRAITFFKGGLYLVDSNVVLKYNTSSYKDEDMSNPGNYDAITYELESAYTNLNSANKHKKLIGFEPIINTDFDGSKIGMLASADFGRKTSATAHVALQSGYNIPFFAAGVEGAYLQYRFDGESDTTSTDGYEFYSMGVCVK